MREELLCVWCHLGYLRFFGVMCVIWCHLKGLISWWVVTDVSRSVHGSRSDWI